MSPRTRSQTTLGRFSWDCGTSSNEKEKFQMQRAKTIALLLGLIAFAANIATYAQQHEHAQHTNQTNQQADDDVAIFCPTMKTGQLCSHGTANVLQLKGDKQEKWIKIAQKYDRAVNAATLQL